MAEAAARFAADVAALPLWAIAEPSLLPGWTRGHALTHLARSADGFVSLLTWTRAGEATSTHGEADARERDVEAGAGRPVAEQLAGLRAVADRMAAAIAGVPPGARSGFPACGATPGTRPRRVVGLVRVRPGPSTTLRLAIARTSARTRRRDARATGGRRETRNRP
jgi:uncharacterized protein (TIGR03083 family)